LLDIFPENHSGPDSASAGLAHRIIIKPSSDPLHYPKLYLTWIIEFLIQNLFMRIQHGGLKQARPVFTKLRIGDCLRPSCQQIRAASIGMQMRLLQSASGIAKRSARAHLPGAPSH